MTQPPDDRRPDQPGDEGEPENEPTVTWTPPEPEGESQAPAEEGGVGYAAIPDEGAPASSEPPPVPAAPSMPTEPPAQPPTEPPAQPSGPIISATPAPPASGWETPGQSGTPPAPAAGSGWEVPTAPAAAAPAVEGYVIAGPGARIVAWLIDYMLAGFIPGIIGFALVDWAGLFRRMFEAVERSRAGDTLDPNALVFPITLDLILANLIATGVLYLYFVFFWTSRWRATPGMIGLKMRVVDAMSGGELSLLQATKRWIAFGFWVPLLGLTPGLQNSAGLIQLGLWVFLFFTMVTNDRRQGLHDRWANALVIRSATSGDGTTLVGCLVLIVIVILLLFIGSVLFFVTLAPSLPEIIDSLPSPSI